MTKLDEAKPRADGNYPVEISINDEWITLALLNRQGVERLCDYAGQLQEEGYVMTDTPAPLSADSLRDQVKSFNESFLRCPVKGCYENEHMRFIDYDVLGDHIQYSHIAAALQAERQRIADSLPEKKTLKTDIDDSGWEAEGQKFCVECGQYEFEGVLDCHCVGFNDAIEAVRAVLIPPPGDSYHRSESA